jgi:serine/threonine protein kinase/WD40 repeat protein/tetratricopeptide (TPR) repeat protein
MSDKQLNLDSLFLAALEIQSPQKRAAFLLDACGRDTSLRSEVEQLLRSHEQAGGVLDQPAPELDATTPPDSARQDRADHERAAALQAGLAAAFPAEAAVVIGDAKHSVLKTLEKTLDVPRVVLREADQNGDPIVRPKSPEMPDRNSDSRYQLQGEIARGGMGSILKGRDTDLGRDLAIKVLLEEHKHKPDVIQRFVEEAQIGGQLQHPGIAPVYELGQFADRRPFFSMKLVKGETLSKLLADRAEPSAERGKFLGIFEQVCQTMAYAHSRGVIHRDLKPANIMVGAFGEVQVMDWGLAKVLPAGGVADEKKAHDTQMGKSIIQTLRSGAGSDTPGTFGTYGSDTAMGSVMGTPAYMPPEQALGEIDNMDERADVFGLGAILCEILTGKPPYVGTDGTAVFRQASRGKLNDCLARLDACGADAELVALTKHCLELEPKDRPRDAGVLAAGVSEYLESVEARLHETQTQRAVQVERLAQQQRSARKLRKMVAGLAVVAAIAVTTSLVAGRLWQDANVARGEAEENLAKARTAEKEATKQRDAAQRSQLAAQRAQLGALDQTYLATLNEVRSMRLARQPGWRATALDRLQSLVQLGSRNRDPVELRSEALECLMGMDLRLESRLGEDFDAWRMEYSPDGQTVAISSVDQVTLRDVATQQEVQSIPKTFKLSPFAFHPSGSLAVASAAERVTFHPLRTGQPSFPEITGDGHALNLAFSSSGDRLAVVWGEVPQDRPDGHPSAIRRAAVYETATGAMLWNADLPENTPTSYKTGLALSPDGQSLATVGPGRQVRLYSVGKNEEPIILGNLDRVASVIKFHPDGQMLVATGNMVGAAWDLRNNAEMFRIHALEGGFWDVAFSPDGQLLAAVLNGNIVRFWRSRNGAVLASAPTETGNGLSLAFSPMGDRFAVGGGLASIFQIEGRRACRTDQSTFVRQVTFDPSQAALHSIGGDNRVRTWKLTEQAPTVRRNMERTTQWPRIVRLAPDGRHLAIGFGRYNDRASDDFSISIWSLPDLQSGRRLAGPKKPVLDVAFDPSGRRVAAASEDGGLYLWEFETGELQQRVELPGIRAVRFLDESQLVVAVGNRLILLAAADGEVRREQRFPTSLAALVVTSDRSAAIVLTKDGTIHRVRTSDLAIEQSQLILDRPSNLLMSLSPDDRFLAVSTHAGPRTLLIDAKTLETLTRFPAYDTGVTDIEFDRDGRYFAIGGTHTDVWDLALVRGQLMRLGLDFGEYQADEALAVFADAVDRAPSPEAKGSIIATAAALPGVLEKLADHASGDGPFQAELAQHFSTLGELQLASAAYAKARVLFEQQLAREPSNSDLAIALADLLDSGEPTLHADERGRLELRKLIDPWARLAAAFHMMGNKNALDRVLKHHPNAEVGIAYPLADEFLATSFAPLTAVEMISEAGTKLTLRSDGSILASEEPLLNDTYTITTRAAPRRIAAIRLEALPDASIQGAGPGWGGGNFHLTEIRAVLRRSGQDDVPLTFQTAVADHARSPAEGLRPGDGPWATIDGNQQTLWDIWPQTGQPHWLLLPLTESIDVAEDDRVVVHLDFRDSQWPRAKLGCFRLSVAADESSVTRLQLATAVGNADLSSDETLAAAYLAAGNATRAAELLKPTLESDDSPARLILRATAQRMQSDLAAARATANRLAASLTTQAPPRKLEELCFTILSEFAGLDRPRFSTLLDQAQFQQELRRLNQELEAGPASAAIHHRRGVLFARRGRWREGADDYLQAVELDPANRLEWGVAASALLMAGDEEGYRRHCRAMLKQFEGVSEAPMSPTPFVRPVSCCPTPWSFPNFRSKPCATQRRIPGCRSRYRSWFMACNALISYREGKPADALDWTGKMPSMAWQPGALGLVVRAMSEEKLGRHEQAVKSLAEAEALIPVELRTLGAADYAGPLPVPAASVNHDWLVAEILRREAEALINSLAIKSPPADSLVNEAAFRDAAGGCRRRVSGWRRWRGRSRRRTGLCCRSGGCSPRAWRCSGPGGRLSAG